MPSASRGIHGLSSLTTGLRFLGMDQKWEPMRLFSSRELMPELRLGDDAPDNLVVPGGADGAEITGIGMTVHQFRFSICGGEYAAALAPAGITGGLDGGMAMVPRQLEEVQYLGVGHDRPTT